jgi:ubiquinone/menaquinone biosynthesis C-methylase UbiE
MRWLRKSQLDPLAVTMSGVKLADRLLVLGGSDTALIGALAGKAGLTGRSVVVDASPAVTSASATAVERDGHLIESFTAPWSMLPFDPHTFDVVVVRDVLNSLSPEERLRCAREVHRVLRPGGRTVVIEGKTPSLLGGLLGAAPPVDRQYGRSGGASHILDAAGFRAARTLAERQGQQFVEGIKANE